MITANMHEAKTRLSDLVRAVEETGEPVILQRNGVAVAQILPLKNTPKNTRRNLTPEPALKPIFAKGYNPTEPLTADEWPDDLK